jgi:hypothetical protein
MTPKFVIEGTIPGAGSLSAEQLKAIRNSCGVLKNLGPQIQWLQSYSTDDNIYCVYIAPDEAIVWEHAKPGTVSDRFSARRASDDRPGNSGIACLKQARLAAL